LEPSGLPDPRIDFEGHRGFIAIPVAIWIPRDYPKTIGAWR
jgi:hypothetical protein